MSVPAADFRIRGLRPAKRHVDPFRAHGTLLEEERRPGGAIEKVLTVFLAGAECPFACSFCDLWQWTIDGPTPPGALTAQVEQVLRSFEAKPAHRIKLYNASNFFDPRAVPPKDSRGLATLVESFEGVTVESHASTIGRRALSFSRSIPGRLEVAIGLETIHPVALAESNKRLDLPRFDRAVSLLKENGIDVRVFVLLGAPFVPRAEVVDWTLRTVEYAAEHGAGVISIIPVRGGNGELERLRAAGSFTPPTLAQLEQAMRECERLTEAAVTADVWDSERLPACVVCKGARVERLRRANLTGRLEGVIHCDACSAS